jgi:hypothetical protein
MDERAGRIARAVERTLFEEGSAERDPVEAARERLALVDFDAVAMAALVELR